jgi:hypothetical protein
VELDGRLISHRAQRDAAFGAEINQVLNANLHVYGADKICKQLNLEGIGVLAAPSRECGCLILRMCPRGKAGGT